MTKHLRIAVDGRVEPINVIGDLVASDGRSLYCTIPDDPLVVFHYPYTDDDVKSVTISKQDSAVSVDVQTAVDHRVRFLDRKALRRPLRSAARVPQRRGGPEALQQDLDGRVSRAPEKEIIRVMTRDKKAYIMHGGVILSVGLTLRLTRVFGKVLTSGSCPSRSAPTPRKRCSSATRSCSARSATSYSLTSPR